LANRNCYRISCMMLLAVLAISCSTASSQEARATSSDHPGTVGLEPAPGAALAGGARKSVTRSPARRCPTDSAGFPKVTLRPRAGPIGTRIRISIPAGCFKRDWNAGYGVFLLRQFNKPRECELIGSGGFRLRVNAVGEARGYVIAPARGHCFQHTYSRAATPGRYVVGFGCHACGGPTFTTTSTRQPDSLEERD